MTKVRKKDIRKFLDGIYVSEKGFIESDEAKLKFASYVLVNID